MPKHIGYLQCSMVLDLTIVEFFSGLGYLVICGSNVGGIGYVDHISSLCQEQSFWEGYLDFKSFPMVWLVVFNCFISNY